MRTRFSANDKAMMHELFRTAEATIERIAEIFDTTTEQVYWLIDAEQEREAATADPADIAIRLAAANLARAQQEYAAAAFHRAQRQSAALLNADSPTHLRNAMVVTLFGSRETVRSIADWFGLSRTRVYQILRESGDSPRTRTGAA